jgi:dihydrofolate synthase/folylpolyglutamate synthase
LELPLLGAAQRENVAVAVATLEVVEELLGVELAFKAGLEGVCWPGRMMEVSQTPSIWLDGSHNPQGGEVLAAILKECFEGREIGFVVGFLEDKDAVGYVRAWKKWARCVWAVPLNCRRGCSAEETATQAALAGVEAKVASLREAWSEAETWALAEPNRMVVVCGSFYLMEACVEEGLLHAGHFQLA